jgi:cytochrome oxidase assembly protein ShyY1
MRLVAASAPPGLEPSAPPSLDQIPNNHRSYAVQWFAVRADRADHLRAGGAQARLPVDAEDEP